MLKRIIISLIILVSSTFANANVDYETINLDAKTFKAEQQPILIKRKFIKKGEPEILVMTEDFGMLYMETNFDLRKTIQSMPSGQDRTDLMGIGYDMAKDLLAEIYGIKPTEFQPGMMRVEVPALSPDGFIMMVDVTFIRDGLMYKARLGKLISNLDDPSPASRAYFIYPMTR